MSKGTALVTGAARRIGRQIAFDLADDGYAVGVHCNHSMEEGEEVAQMIKAKGGKAVVVQGNLAEMATLKRIIAETAAAFGPLNLLINSASVFENDLVEQMTPESFQIHMDVNLRSPVFLAQAFAAQLPSSKDGNIINIIDQRVWRLNPSFFSYTLAKSALWTATRTMAQSLAPRIRVNAIGPGPTLPSARMTDAEFAKQQSLTPLGRGTSPEEISRAIKFIVSQPAMTGQMIALDGGQHLAWATADVIEVDE
jgi:NAD(P)-dependent dehydrogenase (short-subunit alcohol dehydrogenase family)